MKFQKLLKPSSKTAKWLILISLSLIAILAKIGLLHPIVTYLDSPKFEIHLGKYQFTILQLISNLAFVIILFWLASILSDLGSSYIKKLSKARMLNSALLDKVFQILLYFIISLIGLDILNIDLTTLTVFSGAIGIGVGFGLQKISSNYISGLILLFERSIKEGDLIELKNGLSGFVRHIRARSILLETPDNREVIIPNEELMANCLVNYTYSSNEGRIEIPLLVTYESSIDRAMDLMIKSVREHDCYNEHTDPECFVKSLGEKGISLLLSFSVPDISKGKAKIQSDIMRAILAKFKSEQITIPFSYILPGENSSINQGI